MDEVTAAVLAAATSPSVYLLVFVLVVADAFLVVVPSETVVVALGALSMGSADGCPPAGCPSGGGVPLLWLVVVVAAAGAIVGDTLVFGIGRSIGLERFGWMRRPRSVRAFATARRALERRAALALLTARFIPFARIAVDLTAGTTAFPYRRFLALTSVAGCLWAVYNVGIGAFFGAVFDGSPLIAALVSVVIAIGIGIGVDAATSAVRTLRRSEHR